MPLTAFRDRPLEFIRAFLGLQLQPYSEQVFKEAATRKGRFGLSCPDSLVLIETVYALAVWRAVCCSVPSQLVTGGKETADNWHRTFGLLATQAVPLVQDRIQYVPQMRCYRACCETSILVPIVWPEIIKEFPGGSDIYLGDFEHTPLETIEDAGRLLVDDCLLVLPHHTQ